LKRSCLIFCSSAASALALALPGVGLADSSTDGWSWNGGSTDGWSWTGESSDPSPDGWSWGDGEAAVGPDPAAGQPAPDGWSWGEADAAPASAG
jgi:hypothetical protein